MRQCVSDADRRECVANAAAVACCLLLLLRVRWPLRPSLRRQTKLLRQRTLHDNNDNDDDNDDDDNDDDSGWLSVCLFVNECWRSVFRVWVVCLVHSSHVSTFNHHLVLPTQRNHPALITLVECTRRLRPSQRRGRRTLQKQGQNQNGE